MCVRHCLAHVRRARGHISSCVPERPDKKRMAEGEQEVYVRSTGTKVEGDSGRPGGEEYQVRRVGPDRRVSTRYACVF